ncbi:MAG: hypothetical protein IEMM0002_1205 [bacterium]|nr:MAG: hypothetical protein IEMM0002_1205 [bacterium]
MNKVFFPLIVFAVLFAGGARGGSGEANFAAETAINASWIKHMAEKHIRSSLALPVTDFRILEIKPPPARMLPADFDAFNVTGSPSEARGKTRVLSFVFYKNKRIIKRLRIPVKVELFGDVVSAKTVIRRGDAITPEMLEIAKSALQLPATDFYTEIASAKGLVAVRNIKPGRAILRSDIVKPPDVRSGEIVLMVAERENVVITAKGIAKKDGKIGESIPVVNLRSNKKIYARVIGEGRVRVAF